MFNLLIFLINLYYIFFVLKVNYDNDFYSSVPKIDKPTSEDQIPDWTYSLVRIIPADIYYHTIRTDTYRISVNNNWTDVLFADAINSVNSRWLNETRIVQLCRKLYFSNQASPESLRHQKAKRSDVRTPPWLL